MNRTTIHIASFGLIYGSPKQRDILSSVEICVNRIYLAFVIGAFKNLVRSFTNVFTRVTSLACISRIDNYQFNPIQFTFVSNKRTQLSKIPSAKFCAERFVSSPGGKTDISQIFHGNSLALFFCRGYNRLTNRVIDDSCRSFFSPTEPFQKSLRTSRAFGLNGTTNRLSFLSVIIKPFGRMLNAIRCNNNVIKPQITTNKFLNIFGIFLGNINGLTKIKFAILEYQIRFAFYVRNIFLIITNKWNFKSSANRPDGHKFFPVRQNARIISDSTKRPKFSWGFFVKFVGVIDFRNATHNHLSGKIKRGFNRIVNFFVKSVLVINLFCERNFRNFIATLVRLNHCLFEIIDLVFIGQQLYSQRQFHNTKVQNNFTKAI